MDDVLVQQIENRKTTPVEGLLIVAIFLVGSIVLSLFSRILHHFIHPIFSLVVWAAALIAAYWLLRQKLLNYRYTVSAGTLYLERLFGRQAKVLETIPLMDIRARGTLDQMTNAHPDVKVQHKLTLDTCPLNKVAYLYRKKGLNYIAVLQPNPEMATALWDVDARAKRSEEKWGPSA